MHRLPANFSVSKIIPIPSIRYPCRSSPEPLIIPKCIHARPSFQFMTSLRERDYHSYARCAVLAAIYSGQLHSSTRQMWFVKCLVWTGLSLRAIRWVVVSNCRFQVFPNSKRLRGRCITHMSVQSRPVDLGILTFAFCPRTLRPSFP